ncbi:head-tail connector protein [Clostridium perfringens]|uniref:head-tail connector protein n=1 Tax=Clostridium perfringens TaxID=1502 RepID=UPI003F90675A
MISLEEVKSFLRLDDNLDDNYIETILIPSAIGFVTNYTGLSRDQIEEKPELKSAILLTCSMLHDNRDGMLSSQFRISPVLKSILDLHSIVTIA